MVSPLPFLHSEFPLLSAVANPTKTAVSFIQSSARDILHTISELIAVPVCPLTKDEPPASRKASSAVESTVKSPQMKPEEDGMEKEVEEGKRETDEDGVQELNDDEEFNPDGSPTKKSTDQDDGSDIYDEPKEEMSAVVCDWR